LSLSKLARPCLGEGKLTKSLNQLPYLDAKHEYLWGSRMVSEIADRDVPTLRVDKPHTVRSLTGKLLELARLGLADTGFPLLVKEPIMEDGRQFGCFRVVGFLGMNELEHALCKFCHLEEVFC
jgi:chloride channel 3/4/5